MRTRRKGRWWPRDGWRGPRMKKGKSQTKEACSAETSRDFFFIYDPDDRPSTIQQTLSIPGT